MKPFRSATLLLGLLCLTASSVAAQANDRKFELQCRSDDQFLQVYADHPVESARCRSIVDRILKTYAFITKQADWKNPGIVWAKPLRFRLLGGALNVLGYAQGPNLMVMRDDYLDKPLSEGTLAHELTHIQDLRQLQGKKLPSYLLEGRALTIGNAYRMSVGRPRLPTSATSSTSLENCWIRRGLQQFCRNSISASAQRRLFQRGAKAEPQEVW